MGGCKICAWDFRPGTVEVLPMRKRWAKRCQAVSEWANRLRSHRSKSGLPHPSAAERGSSPIESDLQNSAFGIADMDQRSALALHDAHSKDGDLQLSAAIPSAQDVSTAQICRYRSHQEVVHTVQSLQDTIQLVSVSSTLAYNRAVIPGREYDVPENAVPKLRDLGETMERKWNSPEAVSPAVSPQHQMSATVPRPETLQLYSKEMNKIKDPTRWYTKPLNIIKLILTPPSISLFLALPISLVQPAKAMFVHVDGWTGGKMPNGPDGKPPLSWLLDVSAQAGVVAASLINVIASRTLRQQTFWVRYAFRWDSYCWVHPSRDSSCPNLLPNYQSLLS